MKSETLTMVLVNLAGIMERADESLLRGVTKKLVLLCIQTPQAWAHSLCLDPLCNPLVTLWLLTCLCITIVPMSLLLVLFSGLPPPLLLLFPLISFSPIFAEIVPERSRTTIYALDRSFESILASFAPPVVGLLAQHVYGYKPVPKAASNSAEVETDRENAASLAKALYTAIGIPMAICCFIYSFLYCTYPRDRERARMDLKCKS